MHVERGRKIQLQLWHDQGFSSYPLPDCQTRYCYLREHLRLFRLHSFLAVWVGWLEPSGFGGLYCAPLLSNLGVRHFFMSRQNVRPSAATKELHVTLRISFHCERFSFYSKVSVPPLYAVTLKNGEAFSKTLYSSFLHLLTTSPTLSPSQPMR